MTTPYHIKVAPKAQSQIAALSEKNQKAIIQFIEALAINPRPPGAKKVEGMTGLYCEDVRHMRLIYKIEEQEILLLVVK